MTAAAGLVASSVLAWPRPRAAPASRGRGRFAPASAFHPDVSRAVDSLQGRFREVDLALALNSARVSAAFRAAHVAPHHFGGSTGYGHDDGGGREALDSVFAEIVGAEAAIVRPQFFSGTHAIACALFALLRPGHELLAVAGPPYDTLEEVIGIRGSANVGSLKDFGVAYREVPLMVALIGMLLPMLPETGCAFIQRSCGYSWRKSLSISDIKRAIDLIKMQNPKCMVMVDNCYGEFVETSEPPMVGADLIAGSLIKNPGGTIAPCGGYVAGKKDLVAAAAARLSAPGLGVEFGSTPGHVMRSLFQGLFLAPQMVGEAVKGGLLIAEVMSNKGYRVQPLPRVPRHDIVQAVELGNRERLVAFCEVVQQTCPVGSFIKPTAGETPGYASEVIFADGTFIDGSTSELSCDGPLRDPYAVFCQGGTHWTQWALVLSAEIA
uniref:Aminotransferase class I/classII domain-containing protein n=1 Tax=Leersia perrieri TaxID=77586 RepID=A0A0D9WA32_9ORYZ